MRRFAHLAQRYSHRYGAVPNVQLIAPENTGARGAMPEADRQTILVAYSL